MHSLLGTLVAGLLLLPSSAVAGQDTWTPLGLYGGVVMSVASDPAPGGIIYAGTTFGGVYRSLDDGASWSPLTNQIDQPAVLALALDPGAPNTVWAGTSDNGVWRSTDAGDTWTQVNTGLTDFTIRALAYEPTGGVLLAGTATGGVFRSTDAGSTWTASNSGLTTLNITDFAVEDGSSVVYLGSGSNGVFRSDDLGQTWSVLGTLPDAFVTAVARVPGNPQLVYAGTFFSGVFISGNGGQTWGAIGSDIGNPQIRDLAIVVAGAPVVYAATAAGLFRSSFYGLSFSPTNIDTLPVSSLGVRSSPAERVVAGVFFNGIMRSAAGDPLTYNASNTGLLNVFAANIRFAPGSNGIIAGSNQGLHASFDGGGGFFQIGTWDGPPGVFEVAQDPNALGRFYVGIEDDGIVKTDFFGLGWARKNRGLVPRNVMALVPDPSDPNRIFATSAFQGVFTTDNAGIRWEGRDLRNLLLNDLAADPANPGTFYASSNVGLFKTVNSGIGWVPIDGNLGAGTVGAISVAGATGDILLANRDTGLFRSTDGGALWSSVSVGGLGVAALATDPGQSNRVYAGTQGGFVYVSTDGGQTFGPAGASPGDFFVNAMVVAPGGDVFAGTLDGVRRSTDGGATWTPVQTGSGAVLDIAVDATNPSRIFAAAGDAGLLLSTDGGASFGAQAIGAFAMSVSHSPGEVGTVLVGTRQAGVLATSDGGVSTDPRFEGMSVFVDSIELDPNDTDTLYAGTIFSGVFKSTDAGDQWTPSGLEGRVVPALHVSATTADPILAGTDDGVFSSTDQGQSWFKYGLDREELLAIENHPGAPGEWYVSVAPGELFRSLDSGVTFSDASNGLSGANVIALEGDPFDVGGLFAGSEKGLFRSRDKGSSWQAVGSNLGAVSVLSLYADRSVQDVVFAGTNQAGLFRSVDGGDAWIPLQMTPDTIRLDGTGVSALTQHPGEPGAVYAGLVGGAIHRTVDGGEVFADVSPGGVAFNPLDLAGDPFDGDLLFAATDVGIRTTSDRGVSWTDTSVGLPGLPVLTVLADPVTAGTIYAGTAGGGLYRSTDGAASWQHTPISALAFGLTTDNVLAALVHPADPARILVGTGAGEVYRSADGANSFAAATTSLGIANVLDLAGDPLDDQIVLAATEDGFYRSTDGGDTWTESSTGLTERRLVAVEVDPADPTHLFVGTNGGGVFQSSNDGASWTALNAGLSNLVVFDLAVDGMGRLHVTTAAGHARLAPSGNSWVTGGLALVATSIEAAPEPTATETLYAAVPGSGVFRTVDGGASWSLINGDLSDLQIVTVHRAVQGGTLFAGSATGATFRSDDDAVTWVAFDAGTGATLPRGFSTVPGTSPLQVLLATQTGGLFVSDDGGATWTPRAAPEALTVNELAFDGLDRLYAATAQGAFRSDDQAGTFVALDQGLAPGAVASIAAEPGAQETLYAASEASGVFKTQDGGATWVSVTNGPLGTDIVQVDPGETSGLVFASGAGGAHFRSDDGGTSWSAISIGGGASPPRGFVSVPGLPTLLYAATIAGLYVSVDAGLTWFPRIGAIPDIVLALDADGSGNLFAGTDAGVFKSSDGGDTWQGPLAGLPLNVTFSSLATSFGSPVVLAAESGGGLQRSADGGLSWDAVPGAVPSQITEVQRLAWPGLFFAAASDGTLHASLDSGLNWFGLASGTQGSTVVGISADATSPLEIQAATDQGLFVSDSLGISWNSALTPLRFRVVNDFATVSSIPGRIYAATSAGVYRSDDSGRSWNFSGSGLVYNDPESGQPTSFVFEVAVNPFVPDRLFAATPGGGIFRSDDAGATWAPMNTGLPFFRAVGIAVDPIDPDHIIAGFEGGGLHEITLTQ